MMIVLLVPSILTLSGLSFLVDWLVVFTPLYFSLYPSWLPSTVFEGL